MRAPWMTELSGDQLRRHTGSIAQIAGIRQYELTEGRARGLRVAEVYTGSGFRFQVLLDRALDIGAAEHSGRPLAWSHPALGAPEFYEPEGNGWVRSFGGGLMTTCGLIHFGQTEVDNGQAFGLHGRISHLRGEETWARQEWVDDDYRLQVGGTVRQSALFAENLTLNRTITTWLGANHFVIEDTVRNDGFRPSPHMLLYHCNFGFPVVSAHSDMLIRAAHVRGRDSAADAGIDHVTRFGEPDPAFAEQVFFWQPDAGEDGLVRAAIVNRMLGFGGFVRYRIAELPSLAQWKLTNAGDYVCGLEPATNWEAPRAHLRDAGTLRTLQPGEEIHYRVELGALPDERSIEHFDAELLGKAG